MKINFNFISELTYEVTYTSNDNKVKTEIFRGFELEDKELLKTMNIYGIKTVAYY